MSDETVAAEMERALFIMRELGIDIDSVAKRAGTFDHEAKAMGEMCDEVRAILLRARLWLDAVGKETR